MIVASSLEVLGRYAVDYGYIEDTYDFIDFYAVGEYLNYDKDKNGNYTWKEADGFEDGLVEPDANTYTFIASSLEELGRYAVDYDYITDTYDFIDFYAVGLSLDYKIENGGYYSYSEPSDYKKLVGEYNYDSDFIFEGLVFDVSTQLKKLMQSKGLTPNNLTEQFSADELVEIFSGNNIDLKTIAKFLSAIKAAAKITIKEEK